MKNKCDDSRYEIESLSQSLKVLEALINESGKPVSLKDIMKNTGFSRDFCERRLKTFRLNGYAIQTENGDWMLGQKILRIAGNYSELVLNIVAQK